MEPVQRDPKKLYYTMGEVTEMFDVNASLIRFWEQKFEMLKPRKNKKGNRLFTPEDLDTLGLIYHLVKERGMTLEGARRRLRDNREGLVRDKEIVDRLLAIRAQLARIRDELCDEAGVTVGEEESGTEAAWPADEVGTVAATEPRSDPEYLVDENDTDRCETVGTDDGAETVAEAPAGESAGGDEAAAPRRGYYVEPMFAFIEEMPLAPDTPENGGGADAVICDDETDETDGADDLASESRPTPRIVEQTLF